ncbi:MAG: DoxX family protein [Cyclobacteriaceae bacterium]
MNTTVWILQGLMSFVFVFSGINKTYYDAKTLVSKGQTGVEGLNPWFIKFIWVSEILGAFGLILPMIMGQFTILTPIAAICLAFIMIPAALIHYERNEIRMWQSIWLYWFYVE